MVASYSYTWTEEYGRTYFGQTFATAVSNFSLFGAVPDQPERADAQRVHQLEREVLGLGGRGLGHARDAGAENAERRAVRRA